MAHRDVVRDAVEPRAHVTDLSSRLERLPRLKQSLLERVLRASGPWLKAATVGQQLLAISMHKGFEGWFVPLAGELDQAAIWLRLEEME